MTNEINVTSSVGKVIRESINCTLPVCLVFSRAQRRVSDVITTKQGHKDSGFKPGSIPSNHINSSVMKKQMFTRTAK